MQTTRSFDILPHLMRPAGAGIPTFSAGKGAAFDLQTELYFGILSRSIKSGEDVDAAWKASWSELAKAKVVLIGVPLDTGAGIRRGAAYGPRGVRRELYRLDSFRQSLKNHQVIDLGDIYVNPHILDDEMLNNQQLHQSREEMYGAAAPELRATLPVSALTQLRVVLEVLSADFPQLKFQIIGGDHSVAWPVSQVLAKRFGSTLGIVQPDAHTDLLKSRLGVKYCFGTWSYHANQLLGGGGKMVQLGIRQSGKDKAHWENTMGVKQYWATEINENIAAGGEDRLVREIADHLKARGVKEVYLSNDIDGTDPSEAPATGTPAEGGIPSSFLMKVIKVLGKEFNLVAADVVEVAPELGADAEARTCKLAAQYMAECLTGQLK